MVSLSDRLSILWLPIVVKKFSMVFHIILFFMKGGQIMYERFVQLLQEKGITAYRLSKEIGISQATFTDWKMGRGTPKIDKLQKISEFFGIQLDWLTGDSEFKTKEEWLNHLDQSTDLDKLRSDVRKYENGQIINVLGEVAAGIPIEAVENIVDTEEITEELAKTGGFFGLKIKGDSMSPRIAEGDTVIVREQDDAETGEVVIALVNGDSATCKRLMKHENGISLISFNPTYKPMEYTNEQIETLPVKIIGKVVENRQKY